MQEIHRTVIGVSQWMTATVTATPANTDSSTQLLTTHSY